MENKKVKSDKFAVIELNNKQYTVHENDFMKVDRISDPIINVLMVTDGDKVSIGEPFLDGFGVEIELIENKKDKKITVSRFRNKSRYRRNKGFRQPVSILKVKSIGERVKSKISIAKKKVISASEPES